MKRFLLAAMLMSSAACAQSRPVTLVPPARNFGYFVGDTMHAEAEVALDPSDTLVASSLPSPGPVSTWMDLRAITTTESTHEGRRSLKIALEYQSFYDPEEAGSTDVPGFALVFSHGTSQVKAQIPGWSFLASPFRHDLNAIIDSKRLRPDHPYLHVDLRRPGLAFLLSSALAVLALLWGLHERYGLTGLGAGRRPFAAAARSIARMSRAPDATASREAALVALHRAFDATAGRRILATDVELFLHAHPRFRGLQSEIERFFRVSRNVFYGQASAASLDDAPLGGLAELGRRLGRAERSA